MNKEKVIVGNTVGPPLPRSDLRETDPKKGSYVLGRELLSGNVKTVNGQAPDDKGNVEIETPEKAELEAFIASELAKRGQIKPEFADSVEECTDTTKFYVLPDGYFYAYTKGAYVDILTADAFAAASLSVNGIPSGTSATRIYTKNILPLGNTTISVVCPANYSYLVYFYNTEAPTESSPNVLSENLTGKTSWFTGNVNNITNLTCSTGTNAGATHCRISFKHNSITDLSGYIEDLVGGKPVTVNARNVERWFNTGHAFNQPADYEDRLIALEKSLDTVLEDIAYGEY